MRPVLLLIHCYLALGDPEAHPSARSPAHSPELRQGLLASLDSSLMTLSEASAGEGLEPVLGAKSCHHLPPGQDAQEKAQLGQPSRGVDVLKARSRGCLDCLTLHLHQPLPNTFTDKYGPGRASWAPLHLLGT